jgi:hypothetical protein
MIDHSTDCSPYQTMTNLLSPTSSSSSTSNQQDLLYPSSIYHQHSSEVIVSPHRSSLMIQPSNSTTTTTKTRQHTHEQTDSDCDLDSSSSSSITNSSKLKKRRANLPKDSVRRTVVRLYETISCFI